MALLALLVGAGPLDPGPAHSQSAGRQSGHPAVFDAHIHYSAPDWPSYPPERVLGILARAGIQRALVSSTPDDGTLALYEKDPKRIVPILRPYRTREDMGKWWEDPTVIKRLTELAMRENLVLHAHSDDAAIVGLFKLEPRLRVIWAHAGMSSGPREVGALMDCYSTLWAD